jgi:hypothetical protein
VGAVAGLQGGQIVVGLIGDEALKAVPVDVGERELGAGMRALAADDEPGAGGETVGGESAGDLADFGVFPQVPVDVDGCDPVGGDPDGFADRFGDRQADGEPDVQVLLLAQGPDVGEEAVAGAGRITAQQDRGAVPVRVGDLGEGVVEDGDVVAGGVRPGPAFP